MLASDKGRIHEGNCSLILLLVLGSEMVYDLSSLMLSFILVSDETTIARLCIIVNVCVYQLLERVIFLYLFINLQLDTYVIIVRVFS